MSGIRKNEKGVVSILITMIMIVVITLIVLGFAQVSRRNQREALDNQLSTQAYYAAESGANAAINYLTDPHNFNVQVNDTTDCRSFITTLANAPNGGASNVLDSGTKTKYACLLVDTEPTTINVSASQGASTIVHLANTDGQAFTALNFQWSRPQHSDFPAGLCNTTGSGGTTLPPFSSWHCPYGILRIDLVDTSAFTPTNTVPLNSALDNNHGVVSLYLVPSYVTGTNAVSVTWSLLQTQDVNPTAAPAPCDADKTTCPVRIVPVSCTSSGGCSLTVKLPGGTADYYARLSTIYQDSNSVVITGGDASNHLNSATGAGVQFVGGQAVIDSTGEAQDELRRIQVRIPLNSPNGPEPAFGLQTTVTLCKQLSVGPGITTVDSCPNHP